MRTFPATIAITCPDWCRVDVREHVANLYAYSGQVAHASAAEYVEHHRPARDSAEALLVQLVQTTRPDGEPTTEPRLRVGEHLITFDQANGLAQGLANAIRAHIDDRSAALFGTDQKGATP